MENPLFYLQRLSVWFLFDGSAGLKIYICSFDDSLVVFGCSLCSLGRILRRLGIPVIIVKLRFPLHTWWRVGFIGFTWNSSKDLQEGICSEGLSIGLPPLFFLLLLPGVTSHSVCWSGVEPKVCWVEWTFFCCCVGSASAGAPPSLPNDLGYSLRDQGSTNLNVL